VWGDDDKEGSISLWKEVGKGEKKDVKVMKKVEERRVQKG